MGAIAKVLNTDKQKIKDLKADLKKAKVLIGTLQDSLQMAGEDYNMQLNKRYEAEIELAKMKGGKS